MDGVEPGTIISVATSISLATIAIIIAAAVCCCSSQRLGNVPLCKYTFISWLIKPHYLSFYMQYLSCHVTIILNYSLFTQVEDIWPDFSGGCKPKSEVSGFIYLWISNLFLF